MKIKWYGHAAFKMTTSKGTSIIFDPYLSGAFGGAISYGRITEEADVVITSHDHDDHNYIRDINGRYMHINKEGAYTVKDMKIRTIKSFHDASKGKDRGENLISVVEADGLVLTHLGDLGHTLEKDMLSSIGKVDILLIPVGGFFTIDAEGATKVMNDIMPSITIPMHFQTDKCSLPIAKVDAFISGKKAVKIVGLSEIEITKERLPKDLTIMVLEPAL